MTPASLAHRTEQCDRFVRTARNTLEDGFGVPFDFWLPGNTDTPVADGVLGALAARARKSRCVDPGECITVEQTGEETLVAVLLTVGGSMLNGSFVIAHATFRGVPVDMLRRLARMCWRQINMNQQVEKYRRDLDLCASQIGDNFEELAFLRTMSGHLDMADVSLGKWHVAELVLPLLLPMLRAEALVLVAADRRDDNPSDVTVGQPVIWVGPRRIDAETCRSVIEHYRVTAAVQPVVDNRVQLGPLGNQLPGIAECILTALIQGPAIFGWLLAVNRTHRQFPPAEGDEGWALSNSEFGTVEASLLGSVSSMLATHGRNVELFGQKEALLVGVVRAMVSAIEAKDPYTCGHSERVAMVAQLLARQLGLVETDCERIYLSGLLHDVGKIGVRDGVLGKPGKLDADEFAEIRRHPDQGWAILQDLDQLDYAFPGVLHHHESFDGNGYPDGLVGDAIPLAARILAVADSFDAMASNRPYRQGMPHEKVHAILHKGAGQQWDPLVVDAFFQIVDQITAAWQSYRPHATPSRQLAAV